MSEVSDLLYAARCYRCIPEGFRKNPNGTAVGAIAFAKVLETLAVDKRSEISTFVAQYKGQPLPEIQNSSILSQAKAIAAAKGGGTIVKP